LQPFAFVHVVVLPIEQVRVADVLAAAEADDFVFHETALAVLNQSSARVSRFAK
jgi:hypothetical protein